MKILFWSEGFWPIVGGMEIIGLQFIEGMQERGHQYKILTQKNIKLKEQEVYNNISIQRFDFQSILAKKEIKNLQLIDEYLQNLLFDFKPDILHLNGCTGWHGFAFRLFKHLFQIPIILTIHNLFYYENKTNPMAREIASFVDHVCCVSNFVHDQMAQLAPEIKPKLRVIYNGSPLVKIKPSTLCFVAPKLLLLGRLEKEKGFETALYAFSLLKEKGSNALLWIAGDGKELTFLRNLTQELALNDSVCFLGEISRDKIETLMNEITIVLIPSHSESFGLVAIEAMQMKRAVIASEIEGLKEIITHNQTGLLVPMKDPRRLCEAIQTLLAHPEKTIEMAENAKNHVLKHFTLNRNMDCYENLYESVILD